MTFLPRNASLLDDVLYVSSVDLDDVILGVILEPLVLEGGGVSLVHVGLHDVLDNVEPPGVLWVRWLIVKACFSM